MPDMPVVPDLPNWVTITLQIVAIIVVWLLAVAGLRLGARVATRRLLERRTPHPREAVLEPEEMERRVTTVAQLVVRIVAIVATVLAILMVLDLFGIDIGPAIAGLGVVGIAVGLGAQALVRDWLSGIFVVVENQYSRGEIVRIAGVEGMVEDFSLRRTLLRGDDGAVHTVPNGQIVVASNLSRGYVPAEPADED